MPRGELHKSERTSKNKKDKNWKMTDGVDEQHSEESEGTRIKQSSQAQTTAGSASDKQKAMKPVHSRGKSAKQVHIAFLPNKYEPLEEDQDLHILDNGKEESKNNQKKYKKFKNNVGKALRYSWKCLVVGLQSFSAAYSGHLSGAATLIPYARR